MFDAMIAIANLPRLLQYCTLHLNKCKSSHLHQYALLHRPQSRLPNRVCLFLLQKSSILHAIQKYWLKPAHYSCCQPPIDATDTLHQSPIAAWLAAPDPRVIVLQLTGENTTPQPSAPSNDENISCQQKPDTK